VTTAPDLRRRGFVGAARTMKVEERRRDEVSLDKSSSIA